MRLRHALLPLALLAALMAALLHAPRRAAPEVGTASGDAVAAQDPVGGAVDGAGAVAAADPAADPQPTSAPIVFPGWVGAGDGEGAGELAESAQPAPEPALPPAAETTEPVATEPPPIPAPVAAQIRVRVIDPAGDAVADAWVRATCDGEERTVRTDAQGRAHLADLGPGTWDLVLLSPGLRLGHGLFELHDYTAGATLELGPGETREARLTAPPLARWSGSAIVGGKPLAGARIRLTATGASGDSAVERTVTTSATGAFALPPVPPGRYLVAIEHQDLGARSIRSLELGEGAHREDLVAEPSEVAGALRDAAGRPVRGAVLWLEGNGRPQLVGRDAEGFFAAEADAGPRRIPLTEVAWTSSDADGFFLLAGIPPGEELVLYVEAPGRAPARRSLALAPGTSRRLDLVLDAGSALDVTLIDAAGNPRAGSWLAVVDGEGRERWVRTDDAGVARWPALPPGEVRVVGRFDGTIERRLRLAPDERAELVLAAPR